jgi:regulator of sirC expression with transglutaminase-like and TPR domain
MARRDGMLGRAREHFAEVIGRTQISLAEAALAIAEEEYPGVESDHCLAAIDAIARQVGARLSGGRATPEIATLTHLNAVLFGDLGFRGNDRDYYDPKNSFLNEVLERRLGIPITLSILYIEVAARLGLRLDGVGFPGHFLVRLPSALGPVFVDPFNKGQLLTSAECEARFEAQARGRAPFERRFLDPIAPAEIIGRVLHNLKNVYFERRDDVRVLWVIDRLLMLCPDDVEERRDRGLVAARLGATATAMKDLAWYLERFPDAHDSDAVQEVIEALRERGSYAN